jgi:Lipoprotein LpqB beta-propeller domain/Sporulation and spore germination
VPKTVSRPLIAAGALAALLLSACATVPDSGAVRPGKEAAPGQQYLLQPVIVGPGRDWHPSQVVAGFLEAISSYAHNYAVAREYLSPSLRHDWDPSPGWGVTVTSEPSIHQVARPPQVQLGASSATNATVSVSAQQIASVSDEGQYQASQTQPDWNWTATLQRFGGQWLLTNTPTGFPPLFVSNFQRVYLPRNLYYLAPGSLDSIHQALVPDPIFVPLQATSVEVAETLVNDLLTDPRDWLSGAAVSALYESSLIGRVTINAGTATVNLGGAIASASVSVRRQVLAQLVWTLASPAFSQPGVAQSVELEINGHPEPLASWSGGQPQQNGTPLLTVPEPDPGQPLYTLAAHNVIQQLSVQPGGSLSIKKTQVLAGGGGASLSSIAISPGGQYVAGIAQPSGAVYYGPLRPGAKLTEWSSHAPFTSLSWDSNGNLWAVATNYVVLLHPGHNPIPVGGLPTDSIIVQLQVAPDGVRAALVTNGPNGNQLQICAVDYSSSAPDTGINGVALGADVVIGTDVPDPTQLTWYDPNDIIVLSQPAGGTELHEVPVNSDTSTPLIPDSGIQSVTSAGPANPLAIGLAHGGLALTQTLNSTPKIYKSIGQSPTYPAP